MGIPKHVFVLDGPEAPDMTVEVKEEPSLEDPLPIHTLSEVKKEPDDPGTSYPASPGTGMNHHSVSMIQFQWIHQLGVQILRSLKSNAV